MNDALMRPAHSLKPQDVCVLLKRALQPDLTCRDLAAAVGVSLGEAHNAVKRLVVARLLLPGPEPPNA